MTSLLLRSLLVVSQLLPAAPAHAAEVRLPAPRKDGAVSVEAALAARRSVRTFASRPLAVADVGQLLWAAQGVTGPEGQRTAPSACRQYPLEIAVVVEHVEGLARGAYRYVPSRHALAPLAPAAAGKLLAPATSEAQVLGAPAVFVVAAVYERIEGPRRQTWSDLEVGLATENLLLEVVALRLGAVVVGGMDAAAARKAVGFTGGEQVVVLVPVGHPAG
jgi:SagB-type dehydrogenase family enzyme